MVGRLDLELGFYVCCEVDCKEHTELGYDGSGGSVDGDQMEMEMEMEMDQMMIMLFPMANVHSTAIFASQATGFSICYNPSLFRCWQSQDRFDWPS